MEYGTWYNIYEVKVMYKEIDISTIKGNGFKNIIGEKYGRLTVIGLSDRKSGRKRYWICKCSCGNIILSRVDMLNSGNTKSCGCLKKEQDNKNLDRTTHGDSIRHNHERIYDEWLGIKTRTENPNDANYPNYGGRGIKLCDDWHEYNNFKRWANENGYNDSLTIERIDVNGDYEPSNCTWISGEHQADNRRTTIWIEWDGRRQNLKQWSKELDINYGTLNSRYHRSGMRPPELFFPVGSFK